MFLVTFSGTFPGLVKNHELKANSGCFRRCHILAHMNNIPIYISVLTFSWLPYKVSLGCDQQGLSELEPPWLKWVKKGTDILEKLLPPGLKVLPLFSDWIKQSLSQGTLWSQGTSQHSVFPPLTAPEISETVGKWQMKGYGADVIVLTCDGMSLICMVAFEMHSEVVLRVPIHLDMCPCPLNSSSIHLMNQSINTCLKSCASEC